jgi:hypothetical protein
MATLEIFPECIFWLNYCVIENFITFNNNNNNNSPYLFHVPMNKIFSTVLYPNILTVPFIWNKHVMQPNTMPAFTDAAFCLCWTHG